jgi:anaerobic magnesium-protoporphyrin IX monomethyl ester cyclase
MGMTGALVQHMPLSLLYASVDSLKAGFEIKIADVRLNPQDWKEDIASKISSADTILVGISVMTGTPIKNALEITRWIKNEYPHIKVVWGGPHATFSGREILTEPGIDFAIAGYGSKPLSQLAKHLRGDSDSVRLSQIAGLLYRNGGEIAAVEPESKFELIDYRDIPYHFIEKDLYSYGQLDTGDRFFSIYSVMGCPYACAFCSSPAQYKNIKIKYEQISPGDVVDHIEYVQKKYGATYIYFIDDDSFVDLSHVENIIAEIKKRQLKIKLGFRGARINEIKKMSDEYLLMLAQAGTNILHIGAESGSQTILDLINKNCTVDDIIEVNKKMARHQEIKAGYNWIVGLPGETLDDLRKTQKLFLRLIEDNPNAIIFMPNKYRPLPGTVLYKLALKHGYHEPSRLEDWINVEAEGNYIPAWYTRKFSDAINMMRVTSFFIDDKAFKIETGNTIKFKLVRLIAIIYAPLAKFRLKHGLANLLFEYKLFQWLSPILFGN